MMLLEGEKMMMRGLGKVKPIRVIDMIFGGPYVGREISNAQRIYARESKDSPISSFIVNNSQLSIGIGVQPITIT